MNRANTKYIVAIGIALIIGGAIVGYGYMDYKYKKEALEQKIKSEEQSKIKEEENKLNNQQKYLECRTIIEESKRDWWNKECKVRGLKEDCQLPFENGDRIREWAEKETNNCLKLINTN